MLNEGVITTVFHDLDSGDLASGDLAGSEWYEQRG